MPSSSTWNWASELRPSTVSERSSLNIRPMPAADLALMSSRCTEPGRVAINLARSVEIGITIAKTIAGTGRAAPPDTHSFSVEVS